MEEHVSEQQQLQSSHHSSNSDVGQKENLKSLSLSTDVSMERVVESGGETFQMSVKVDKAENPNLHDKREENKDRDGNHTELETCGNRNESVYDESHNLSVQQTAPYIEICNVQNTAECMTSLSNVSESILSASQCHQQNNTPQMLPSSIASTSQTLLESSRLHVDQVDATEKTDSHMENSSSNISHGNLQSHFKVPSMLDVAPFNASFTSLPGSITLGEATQIAAYPSCEIRGEESDSANLTSTSVAVKNDSRYALSSVSSMECIASASACFHRQSNDNFLKGCKWSPDGSQIVTNSNDNYLRVFTTEQQNLQCNVNLDPSRVIKEQSLVYDFCWYPHMSSDSPDTCRLACTCSNIPIHLWDSSNGRTVSTYRAYDHCDEIIAAYSLAFSPDGSKIFAGYKKSIRIFDTARPGRICRLLKTYDSQTKEGVPGIISCFAFSQDASPVFVAGSYSRHVGVYDYASQQLIYMMQGQQGGVTHVMLSPDGTKLYTGGRKDPEIVCWDMRNTGNVLFTCLRDVQTNQRIYFDLSESGRYLVSGNHDGTVVVWDTLDPGQDINGEVIIKPCFSFLAHQDCVNGVSFNHQQGILATTSGQRHFMNFDDYDSDSSSSTMSVDDDKSTRDYSLKWWKIPSHTKDFVT